MVAQGWLSQTGDGNKYFVYLIDSCFYENVSFEQLDLDTPLRGGLNWWAFRGEDAVEPYLFYVSYFEIKFLGDRRVIKREQLPAMSNPDNTDLESFFSNGKVWRSKAHRKDKLKKKKAKK